ncbi:hypothetical protein ACQPZF_41610 [Actinosynnema sp. CS-041913]|uniref:hypothetical protein n=1 Tax=Actinosynnema sp. CS-041913 TaxID=3239917 RepID=UPI003D922CBD
MTEDVDRLIRADEALTAAVAATIDVEEALLKVKREVPARPAGLTAGDGSCGHRRAVRQPDTTSTAPPRRRASAASAAGPAGRSRAGG